MRFTNSGDGSRRGCGRAQFMLGETPNVVYLPERQARANNFDVLRRVIRDYEPAIRRFLRARLAHHPDHEDLMQDLYLKLARQQQLDQKLSRGEPQTRAYLFSVAANLIRDRYRSNSIRSEVTLDVVAEERFLNHAPSPEDILVSEQNLAVIKQAILKLSSKCRRAFLLSRIRNLSYREIADEMNISTSMVEKHIMRALAAIRACVQI